MIVGVNVADSFLVPAHRGCSGKGP